jgi:hypothetical protein
MQLIRLEKRGCVKCPEEMEPDPVGDREPEEGMAAVLEQALVVTVFVRNVAKELVMRRGKVVLICDARNAALK